MTAPFVDHIHIGVAGAIGKGQDHDIQVAAGQILGADRLVQDVSQPGHRLTGELAGPGEDELERRVISDQPHQLGPGVAAGAHHADGMTLTHRRRP